MRASEFSAFMSDPFEIELEPLDDQFGSPVQGEVLELYGDNLDRFVCLRSGQPAIWSTQQVIPERCTDKSTLFFVRESSPLSLCLQPVIFRKMLEMGRKIFAVDDRAVDDMRNRIFKGSHASEDELCAWLKNEFFLEANGLSNLESAFVAVHSQEQSRGDEAGFTLVGREYLARISLRNDILLLDSILRHKGQTFLVYDRWQGDFSFSLNTVTARLKDPVLRQQIAQQRSDPQSFLNLWDRYRMLDEDRINQQSKDAGELVYSDVRPPEEGSSLRIFSLKNHAEEVEQFVAVLRELNRDEQEVEIDDGLERKQAGDAENQKRPRLLFSSADSEKREITLEVITSFRRALPKQGVLRLSMHGWHVQNERRRKAFDKISAEQCSIRSLYYHLHEFKIPAIERPKTVRFRESQLFEAFGGKVPNSAQKKAIEICFNSPDIALIQGPPGTGKTQVISAVQRLIAMQQKRQERPESILLTSYQHDAVDNMADRASVFGLPAYRYGSKSTEKSEHGFTKWRDEMLDRLDRNIKTEERSALLQQLRAMKTCIIKLRCANLPTSALMKGIDDLLKAYDEVPPGLLDPILQENLEAVQRRFGRNLMSTSVETEHLRRVIWGLRTTEQSYSDDGAMQVQRLLDILYSPKILDIINDVAPKDTLEWLEGVGAGRTVPLIEELKRLEELQWSLLEALTPGWLHAQACMDDLNQCLEMALKAVNSRLAVCPAGQADILEDFRETLVADPSGVRESIARYTLAYATTCQQSGKGEFLDVRNLHLPGSEKDAEFDYVVVDEAARANPLDLFIPMVLGRRKIILVGDHRQLPQMLEPELEKQLAEQEVDSEKLKESMFERMWQYLRSKPDGETRTVSLDIQYRMHPELGHFVSRTFYEAEGVCINSPREANEFAHQISAYEGCFAVWEDCAEKQEQRFKGGRGWCRPTEARRVVEVASDILRNSSESLGIITMYRGQQFEIMDRLEKEGFVSAGSVVEKYGDRLRVGTVDSFQGREFDVVILSPVRSNRQKVVSTEDVRRKFGFLTVENRLNVALSRQRKLLIVVGDRKIFQSDAAKEHVCGLYSFEKLCREGICN